MSKLSKTQRTVFFPNLKVQLAEKTGCANNITNLWSQLGRHVTSGAHFTEDAKTLSAADLSRRWDFRQTDRNHRILKYVIKFSTGKLHDIIVYSRISFHIFYFFLRWFAILVKNSQTLSALSLVMPLKALED